jgi:hypothetical protein
VVFSHLVLIAFVGNLLVAGFITIADFFPTSGFLLVVGYLVTNCDFGCFVSLARIAAYLEICPAIGY